jgi:hypothetical protein
MYYSPDRKTLSPALVLPGIGQFPRAMDSGLKGDKTRPEKGCPDGAK